MTEYRVVLNTTADYDGYQVGQIYIDFGDLMLDLRALTKDRPHRIEQREVTAWTPVEVKV